MWARILYPRVQQGASRQADHTSCLVHVIGGVPATHREYSVIIDGLEEGAPSLERVEAVLAQTERTRASCRPRVNHAHLHEIKLLRRAREPAAGVVHMQFQIWYGH